MMKKFYLPVFLCLLTITGLAQAKDIYVPDDYGTIQEAIDAADTGDRVVVRDGTWKGEVTESVRNKNLDFGGKAITVKSKNGAANCIIDCEGGGRGFHFHSGEGRDSILTGFTISGGTGNGAGIYIDDSSPTIAQNNITGNAGGFGGGIYISGSSNPLISGNTISGNTATWGGGICNNNRAHPTIADNVITANSAHAGGGIHCEYSDPIIIVNNTVFGNSAQTGGGISFCSASDGTLVNTLVWGNTAPQGPQIAMFHKTGKASTLTVSYCDVQGGEASVYVDPAHTLVWQGGNIDADPLFKDSGNQDFHLTSASPCIDVGDNEAPNLPVTDKDGNPRIVNGTVDMGAYEYPDEAFVAPDGECDGNRPCHSTIQEAIGSANNLTDIKILQGGYAENPIMNSDKKLGLQGGWNSTFATQSSTSSVNSLTIEEGSITVDRLSIK